MNRAFPPSIYFSLFNVRRYLICTAAISAYFAPIFESGNNLVYLFLSVFSVFLALPEVICHRKLRAGFFFLIIAVLWGAHANGLIPSLRSATPYITLLVAFSLLASNPAIHTKEKSNGLALLYCTGLIQIVTYIIQVSTSPSYNFLYSLDEFNRFSIGWVSIICFFHTSLPRHKKLELPGRWRRLGLLFWLVPLLVALNSSRSELLMAVMLASISLYIRSRPLFFIFLLAASIAIPLTSEKVTGIERAKRSFEEVFSTDTTSLVDAYANYRAFENLMMIEKIWISGPFGCGLGCAVNFPSTMVLNEKDYDEVTVFHNGYLTTILHFGLGGVVFIFILTRHLLVEWKFFLRAYNRRSNFKDTTLHASSLRFSTLLLLLGTGFTTGGFMSSLDTLTLLLPLCVSAGSNRKSHFTAREHVVLSHGFGEVRE